MLYDQLADRWLLEPVHDARPRRSVLPFYNCVAISTNPRSDGRLLPLRLQDPGPEADVFFPDYPKYGVWKKSYILTSRDFGPTVEYGISVYALEKNKMIAGNPNARAVQFFLDSDCCAAELIGDGLLPADIDGKTPAEGGRAIPIVGTQDDDAGYGATFDALNIWELIDPMERQPGCLAHALRPAPGGPFDSVFPCAPTARDCLPEPGIT